MFDLRERDMVKWSAGSALRRCAPSGKVLARVLDVDPSTASRRAKGSPGHGMGPEAAHFMDLKRLTEDEKSVPFPLLVGGMRTVLEAIAQTYANERLLRELRESMDAEAKAEGSENCAAIRVQWEGIPALRELVEHGTVEVDAQLAVVVLGAEILRRFDAGDKSVDPRTYGGTR